LVAAWLERRQRKGKSRPEWLRNLRRRLKRWNTSNARRDALSDPMREVLRRELAPEVECLEKTLGRDLSHWR
jgi:hypothetical protein